MPHKVTAPDKQFVASFFFYTLLPRYTAPVRFTAPIITAAIVILVITAYISSFFIEVLFRGGNVNHCFDSQKNDHVVRRDSLLTNKVEDK